MADSVQSGQGARPQLSGTVNGAQISLEPQQVLVPGAARVVLADGEQHWVRFLFLQAPHGATKDEAPGLAPGSWHTQWRSFLVAILCSVKSTMLMLRHTKKEKAATSSVISIVSCTPVSEMQNCEKDVHLE